MTDRKRRVKKTNYGLWNTTQNTEEWAKRTQSKNWGFRVCEESIVKHHNQEKRWSEGWVVPLPNYTGNVYIAHGPGDDDHFLAVSVWIYCFWYFVFLYVMDCDITARSKWYYSFYRTYADPCKIICNALYYRVISEKSSKISKVEPEA
jgi:hypothetical protein